jgi:hypothetical protein
VVNVVMGVNGFQSHVLCPINWIILQIKTTSLSLPPSLPDNFLPTRQLKVILFSFRFAPSLHLR